MNNTLRRLIGASLIVAGTVGLVVCVVLLIAVARTEPRLEASITRQLDILAEAAQTTATGLDIADTTLLQTVDAIRSLEGTVTAIGATVESSRPTLDAVTALLGDQLPTAIETTQETLTSASANAKAVDDFLTMLARIPYLGAQRYEPEQQLHVGLEQVAASLDGVPAALRATRTSLEAAGGSLVNLQEGLAVTAGNVGQIAAGLNGARDTLSQYQGIVAEIESSLASARSSLPRALRWLHLGVSFVLVWLGIVQFALITQGGELMARGRLVRPKSGTPAQ